MTIIFRALIAFEFLICSNVLIHQFKSEDSLPRELRFYVKIRLLLSIVAIILSFFIDNKYLFIVLAIRIFLFLIYQKVFDF